MAYQDEITHMPHEELEAIQLERLQWTAKHCYDNVEFFKQKFDEDEDLAEATAPSEFDEENVMTSMDGYTLDEGGEEGNMFDDSLADEEADDDFFDFDDFGNDEM